MRVLVVSQYFWPEQFRVNEIVKSFKDKGFEVDILTGIPNYPEGQVFKEYTSNKEDFNYYQGARIYRVPIWLRRNSNQFNLFLNYLSFILSGTIFGFLKLRKKKYDYIFTFATSPITVCIVSIFFSKLKKAKSIVWVLDLWPNILIELNIVKNKFLYKIILNLVKKIYLSNDLILAQSNTFVKIINKQIYPHKKDVHFFPAWPENLIDESNKENQNQIISSFSKNITKIVFTGNVGEAQNFDTIFKAAKMLKNEKNLLWIVIGSGRKLEQIKSQIKKEGIKNFIFKGHVPLSEIKNYHENADMLLISLSKGEGLSGTIPGKLQTYLNSKKFIVGLIEGEAKKIIEETNSGKCFDPEDYIEFSNFIKKALKDKELLKIENSISVTEYLNKYFNKKKIIDKLFDLIDKIKLENYDLKLLNNLNNISFKKNFSLSGLNLAFIGFYNLGKIKLHEDLYLWPDGIFSNRFFKGVKKIPGRNLIKEIKLPDEITRVYVLGNLSDKSKKYLESLYSKKVIHIDLPYKDVNNLFDNYCKIKFSSSDIIIITLPTPKQEQLAEKIRSFSQNYKILCVGGAVTMASGEETPIPALIENNGLEFLWRLRTDSKRRLIRLILSFSSFSYGYISLSYYKFKKKIIKELI